MQFSFEKGQIMVRDAIPLGQWRIQDFTGGTNPEARRRDFDFISFSRKLQEIEKHLVARGVSSHRGPTLDPPLCLGTANLPLLGYSRFTTSIDHKKNSKYMPKSLQLKPVF